jgi:hypothetical protein
MKVKTTLKYYLNEQAAGTDLIQSFVLLKKKINELLAEEIVDANIPKYLRFLAIFEQYFRHLKNIRADTSEVPGLAAFIGQSEVNVPDEKKLEKHIESALRILDGNHYINFTSIVDRRSGEFTRWFEHKQKDGLQIINDSLDYVIREFERYRVQIHSSAS